MTFLIKVIVFLKSTKMKLILPYECDYSSEVKLLSRKLMKEKALDERCNEPTNRKTEHTTQINKTTNKRD